MKFSNSVKSSNTIIIFPAEKNTQKTVEPLPKHNRKCNGFKGSNGNCIGFNVNYNGVYWYLMHSIGGMESSRWQPIE